MTEKVDVDRLERIIRKARYDWSWDSLAHDMSEDRYVAEAVLRDQDPGELPLIEHNDLDPKCKHYSGSKFTAWVNAPLHVIFGDICNECRTLGRNARG